jgi:hypothetical protein
MSARAAPRRRPHAHPGQADAAETHAAVCAHPPPSCGVCPALTERQSACRGRAGCCALSHLHHSACDGLPCPPAVATGTRREEAQAGRQTYMLDLSTVRLAAAFRRELRSLKADGELVVYSSRPVARLGRRIASIPPACA